jgi:hypothetical protein
MVGDQRRLSIMVGDLASMYANAIRNGLSG